MSGAPRARLAVVHGPGLDVSRRGLEEPAPGSREAIDGRLTALAGVLGARLDVTVAPGEEALVGAVRAAAGADGLLLTAGELAFSSGALAAAVADAGVTTVDLHLADLRRRGLAPAASLLGQAGARTLHGRGGDGFRWGLAHLAWRHAWPVTTLAYGNGREHVADLRLPAGPGPHPAAVLLHGGFWLDAWERDVLDGVAVDLARRGWATFNVEYRRVGCGGGWPATLDDVRAAVARLGDLAGGAAAGGVALDLDRVVLAGHSAGAYLALMLAAERGVAPPERVVALAPVADLAAARAERLGGGAVDAFLGETPAAEAEPAGRLPLGAAQLVAHCADDRLVPVGQGRRWVAAARAAGDEVAYLEHRDGGHFALVTPGHPAWEAVAAALGAPSGPGRRRCCGQAR